MGGWAKSLRASLTVVMVILALVVGMMTCHTIEEKKKSQEHVREDGIEKKE
jgi:hypothetical protein